MTGFTQKLLCCASLFMMATVSAPLFAQSQGDPATIPDGLLGTYSVTLSTQGGTLFTAGESRTFIVAAGGVLCIDGNTYTNPTVLNLPGRGAWLNSAGDQYFVVQDITTGSFTKFTILSNPIGAYYGVFEGQKTSSDTSGCSASGSTGSGSPSLSADAQSVLDLALEVYPTLFGQGSELKQAQGYVYRFFASSGIYVGFKDGRVYVVGGPFGDSILDKGTVSAVTTALNTAKANIELNGSVDVGGNGAATGELWDITISGTASVLGVTTNIGALTVENVTSTNPASEEEIEKIIEEYFKDYGTITNLEVVIVNNTPDKVTLDLAFKGAVVSQGFTVNTEYNLRYEFNKK